MASVLYTTKTTKNDRISKILNNPKQGRELLKQLRLREPGNTIKLSGDTKEVTVKELVLNSSNKGSN